MLIVHFSDVAEFLAEVIEDREGVHDSVVRVTCEQVFRGCPLQVDYFLKAGCLCSGKLLLLRESYGGGFYFGESRDEAAEKAWARVSAARVSLEESLSDRGLEIRRGSLEWVSGAK